MIVTRDIGAVVVIVNHVKKKDIVVVTVGTVLVKVVVDIVAVTVAVKVVISHTAVHTKTGDSTVKVVVVIRRVDQGRIEMTVDPSANTDLMGKEQTMNGPDDELFTQPSLKLSSGSANIVHSCRDLPRSPPTHGAQWAVPSARLTTPRPLTIIGIRRWRPSL